MIFTCFRVSATEQWNIQIDGNKFFSIFFFPFSFHFFFLSKSLFVFFVALPVVRCSIFNRLVKLTRDDYFFSLPFVFLFSSFRFVFFFLCYFSAFFFSLHSFCSVQISQFSQFDRHFFFSPHVLLVELTACLRVQFFFLSRFFLMNGHFYLFRRFTIASHPSHSTKHIEQF